MDTPDLHQRFEEVKRRFPALASRAGLPDPDEVHFHPEAAEVEFRWHEQKLAVVVELDDPAGPEDPPGHAR
jgi:hypothetical protein